MFQRLIICVTATQAEPGQPFPRYMVFPGASVGKPLGPTRTTVTRHLGRRGCTRGGPGSSRVRPAQGLTAGPRAGLRLPRRRTSHPPVQQVRRRRHPLGRRSTFALFTYAPPSPTARRAAPRLSARPVATSRSTTVGRSASRTSVPGTSASAASSVLASRSRRSPRPNRAAARRHHLLGLARAVHQVRQLRRQPPLRGPQVRPLGRVAFQLLDLLARSGT